MMSARFRRVPPALAWLAVLVPLPAWAQPKVPEGFAIRLVATVPAVQYPCQVATAPGGSLFVAEDPMDQLGPYEADNGRILRFQGEAEPVVFAEGLRAVFGMAWRDGALYVMHMPYLSVFRDRDGDGRADDRVDLFKDLGPGPKALNDHIVSGLQFGLDGKLYISVGDKGVPGATRPEDGVKIQLQGGGTLRCNPDGTGLEVLSTGTRNHLEPNLDDRDNLFTYDNTDDGDGWWTRVTHHIDGGYYGYPYDYHERPDRHLPRIAEFGGGSPCGAVVYREDAWPQAYRGLALWAEWGKRKVHGFRFEPDGASFRIAETIDFVTPGDTGDFRPIDLAVSSDGTTLYIADWSMGGWGNKTEKVGRVYAVTWAGDPVQTRPRGSDADPIPDQIRQLDHPSYNERVRAQLALIRQGADAVRPVTDALLDPQTDPVARRHLLWTLDGLAGGTPEATMPILEVLASAQEPDLLAQAARAMGLRSVPIAVDPLIAALKHPDASVRLQAIIALGRIGIADAVPELVPILADTDPFLAFAARVALRRIDAWEPAIPALGSNDPAVRRGLLATLEMVYRPEAAQALITFAQDPNQPADERARALLYLAETHARVRPWDGQWWGTRPTRGRFPIKDVAWDATPRILQAVREALTDPAVSVRRQAVQCVPITGDPEARPLLRRRLSDEPDPATRRDVARTLGRIQDADALPILVATLHDAGSPEELRDAALGSVEAIGGPPAIEALLGLLAEPDVPADRLARVVAALGRFQSKAAVARLLVLLKHPETSIRAAAAEALGRIGEADQAPPAIAPLLDDPSVEVRKAAIGALGALQYREAIPALLRAADQEPTAFEATLALTRFADPRATRPLLRGLGSKNPDLRRACSTALAKIRDEVAPLLDRLAERKELSPSLLPELTRIYAAPQPILEWRVIGPFPKNVPPPFDVAQEIDPSATYTDRKHAQAGWKTIRAVDPQGQIDLGRAYTSDGGQSAFGVAEIVSPATRPAQMVVGSDDTLTVWLNGQQVYTFGGDRGFAPEQARVEVTLREGVNRVVARCGNSGGGWQYAVAFTQPAEYAFLKAPSPGAFNPDTYREVALNTPGNPARGQQLFADPKGLACLKCHTVQGQGGAVGPDLTGIGSKYPRAEVIDSILYPSAKIFSGYEPVVLATADGRVLTGILKGETPEVVEIEDAEAKRIAIPKADIEDRRVSDVSIMPNGLAEGLTPQDFADLIAYLETLKDEIKK